jgi:hypothetical protein
VKLLIKLALTALIANAVWRVGQEYATYFRFRDAVREAALVQMLDDRQLRREILDLADQFSLPVTESGFTIERQERRTVVEGTYLKPILVFPGYEYLWRFDWDVAGFATLPQDMRDLSPGVSRD